MMQSEEPRAEVTAEAHPEVKTVALAIRVQRRRSALASCRGTRGTALSCWGCED